MAAGARLVQPVSPVADREGSPKPPNTSGGTPPRAPAAPPMRPPVPTNPGIGTAKPGAVAPAAVTPKPATTTATKPGVFQSAARPPLNAPPAEPSISQDIVRAMIKVAIADAMDEVRAWQRDANARLDRMERAIAKLETSAIESVDDTWVAEPAPRAPAPAPAPAAAPAPAPAPVLAPPPSPAAPPVRPRAYSYHPGTPTSPPIAFDPTTKELEMLARRPPDDEATALFDGRRRKRNMALALVLLLLIIIGGLVAAFVRNEATRSEPQGHFQRIEFQTSSHAFS